MPSDDTSSRTRSPTSGLVPSRRNAELAAARLTLVSVSYVYNNTLPVDYVVSQTVEAGTEIPAYSKIYLQISLGPETTPTPSPSPVPTQDPNAE